MSDQLLNPEINLKFPKIFKNEITSIDPFEKLTNEEISIVIKNTKGLKPSLIVPEDAFEVLIKQQIKRLEEPSLHCVKKIYSELLNSLDLIDVKDIKQYKLFEAKIKEINRSFKRKPKRKKGSTSSNICLIKGKRREKIKYLKKLQNK